MTSQEKRVVNLTKDPCMLWITFAVSKSLSYLAFVDFLDMQISFLQILKFGAIISPDTLYFPETLYFLSFWVFHYAG